MNRRIMSILGLSGFLASSPISADGHLMHELEQLNGRFKLASEDVLHATINSFVGNITKRYGRVDEGDLKSKVEDAFGVGFERLSKQGIDPWSVDWAFYEGMDEEGFRFKVEALDQYGRQVYETGINAVNLETVVDTTVTAPGTTTAQDTTQKVPPVTPRAYGRGLGLTVFTGNLSKGDVKTDVPRVGLSYPISNRVRVIGVLNPNTDVASTTTYSPPTVVNQENNIGGGPLSGTTYETFRRTRATARELLFGFEAEIANSLASTLLLGAERTEGSTYREMIEEIKEGARLRQRKPKVVPNTDYNRTEFTQEVGVNFPFGLGNNARANVHANHRGADFSNKDAYSIYGGLSFYLRDKNRAR